ncbi:MAG: hypothetical protein DDT40_01719 [candidate division WS2 bacterium]|nr:hypothetical protein [Candidatus Psychracetigena formicireducens]
MYLTIVEDTKKIDFTGSIEVSPMESTIYTFAALGKNGTTIVEKIPLSVVQPLPVVVEPPPLSLIPPKSGFFIIDPPYYYEAELVLWGIEEINFFNYRVTLNLPTGVEIRTPVGGRLSLGTLMNKVGEKPDSSVFIRWNNDEESILSIAGNGLEILRYDEILWDIERKIAAKAGDVVARVKTPGRVQITFWSKKNPLGDEFVKEFWTYLWVVK